MEAKALKRNSPSDGGGVGEACEKASGEGSSDLHGELGDWSCKVWFDRSFKLGKMGVDKCYICGCL